MRPIIALAVLAALPAAAATAALAGGGASPWSEHNGAALRLIDGGRQADGRHLAGIELRVPPGFKTYWRSPGDSGVPPQVIHRSSGNLSGIDVLFPAPMRFADGAGGHSWGYAGDVTLPLALTPADPAAPVRLSVSVDYAICAKLCIPVQGEAELELRPGDPPDAALAAAVREHLSRVPLRRKAGEAGPLALLALTAGDAPDRLSLDVAVPSADGLEVFVEAPSGWFIDAGRPEPRPGGVRVPVTVAERPREPSALPVTVTVTVVSPAGAIEVPVDLPVR
jgi:suppressor for copper-sensitivity B